uniref:Uncharacterized protein n=1 Tax=Caudovirales sp. ctXjW8 TaxID=2826779 RepID=A0A8S5N6D0_9CAUD|nr:MAG TPA: hypothetical protein [Caudovirales sp. ctXjW8]
MQIVKDTAAMNELTLVSGELQVIKDLLNIFYCWYDDTHKGSSIDRSYTKSDISNMWGDAPMYMSVLHSAFASVGQLQKEVDEVLDADTGKAVGA